MSCNSQKNKPGSRVPIDPKSAKIQELGVWAVNQYNNKKVTRFYTTIISNYCKLYVKLPFKLLIIFCSNNSVWSV